MSFKPDDKRGETEKQNISEESLRYLKVIAFVLCEMQGLDLNQILTDMEN